MLWLWEQDVREKVNDTMHANHMLHSEEGGHTQFQLLSVRRGVDCS